MEFRYDAEKTTGLRRRLRSRVRKDVDSYSYARGQSRCTLF